MPQRSKILIADDDPANITLVSEILEQKKLIVFAANNGIKALEIAHTEIPDLILLDWQMPLMDGLEILEKLKADPLTKDIMVIMITGVMTGTDDLLLAYKMGVIDFIRKPFDKLELLARTETVLKLADSYKMQIYCKNNELMIQTLKLAEDNQFLINILKDITEIKSGIPQNSDTAYSIIHNLENKLKNKITSDIWKEFEESFTRVNPLFHKNLLDKHPDLTPSEIKLCALLLLNLSTKEIASILCQSIEGVRVSRTRLRKKLILESEDNLVTYLIQI